jgi:uncharacterized membrane protein YciS (DUF1049 family)
MLRELMFAVMLGGVVLFSVGSVIFAHFYFRERMSVLARQKHARKNAAPRQRSEDP